MSDQIPEIAALAVSLLLFAVLWWLKKAKEVDFGVRTIVAAALGIAVGLAFPGHYTYVAVFGTVYSNVISALVVPLLAFSIVSSITNLGDSVRLKAIGLKTVFFLVLNTAIASVITLVAGIVTNIGAGMDYELATNYEAAEVPTLVETVVGLFPKNLVSQWADGQIVPLVVFAIIVAVAYNAIAAERAEEVAPFKRVVDAGNIVLGKVVSLVISFTPYAVLSLVARAVSRASVTELLPLLGVLALVYVLCIVQSFVVHGGLVALVGHVSPKRFFKAIWPAATVAFTSQSSVGTVPVTVRSLTERLGVDGDIASFGAGLGANLGMPGCAGIWPTLLAVFTIHVLGLSYTPQQYLFLVVLAVVVSIGTVGVPGTATITATALFTAAGLPVEAIVLLAPISSIADMARTATNVIGAAAATTIVAATEGQLDGDADVAVAGAAVEA